MSKYRIENCNDNALWDYFIENSPQGTIFNKSNFIKSTGYNSSYYFVNKGDETLAAFTIFEDSEHNMVISIPFNPYHGIMFKDFSNIHFHKRITNEYEITVFIINYIIDTYGHLSMSHSPFYRDLRPFLWYNYHTPEKGMFKVNLRYTPILTLSNIKLEEYLLSIRRNV